MATLSRKDIARLLDVSVDQVRNNEREWGLRRYRIFFNARFVRYRREKTLAELIRRKLLFVDSPTSRTTR
jgi:hypothetical protein